MVVTFNLPPVVNAGPDQTVNFGTTVTLAGTVTDDQLPHNILTNIWTEVSGPGNATFADASLTNTTVTFDQPGTYTLRLTAGDTLATTSADVVIRVNAAPVVNAGANQLVTLGTWVTLAGSYTDDGIPGSTVTTIWTQISGPAGVVFTDPTAASTMVNFSQSGVYVFQLTANDGLTNGSAQVTITVDQAPVVAAVSPILINWPANQVTLSGTVSDDGLPNGGTLTSVWSQISGPGTAIFHRPARQCPEWRGDCHPTINHCDLHQSGIVCTASGRKRRSCRQQQQRDCHRQSGANRISDGGQIYRGNA